MNSLQTYLSFQTNIFHDGELGQNGQWGNKGGINTGFFNSTELFYVCLEFRDIACLLLSFSSSQILHVK